MRIHERCKCGAEFNGRSFWHVARLIVSYRKFNAVHARVCMGVSSYVTNNEGIPVITLTDKLD